MKEIDARGLSCPQPLLLARKGMLAGDASELKVLVDCEASIENISRAAKQLGWAVEVHTRNNDEAVLELTKKA